MALIGDLDEAALARSRPACKARITESSVGISAAPDATAMEIAGAAVAFIVEVAPKAPEAIGREAAIRLAGWLLDNRPAVVSHEITDPSGNSIKLAIRQHGGDGFRVPALRRELAGGALHPAPRRRDRLMRWPWQARAEDREATGGYTGIISQLVELQAAGTTQQASATAAMEAAAGALSRAFMGAAVEAPPDIAEAITPRVLAQIGRDLVRVGESLHVIRMSGGRLHLFPASTWYWEGGANPRDWTCTATTYGPSDSETWRVPFDSVVFATWGSPTARPYHGLGPGSWARDTAQADEQCRAIAGRTKRAGRSRNCFRSPRTAATAPRATIATRCRA